MSMVARDTRLPSLALNVTLTHMCACPTHVTSSQNPTYAERKGAPESWYVPFSVNVTPIVFSADVYFLEETAGCR